MLFKKEPITNEKRYLVEMGNGKGCAIKIYLSEKEYLECKRRPLNLKKIEFKHLTSMIECLSLWDEESLFEERDCYKQIIENIKEVI